MKKLVFFALLSVLLTAFSVNAQDYPRLEKLADDLRNQAEDLSDKTFKDLNSETANSQNAIEDAFLAEQFLASAKLIERIIDDKFQADDLRNAGTVLINLSRRFPVSGNHSSDWKQAKDKIGEIDFEFRNTGGGGGIGVAGPSAGDPNNIRGRVFWTGMVDATVHLVIKGSNLETRTVLGKPYPDGIPSFTRALPREGNVTVGVNKKDGRGDVKVIQQPGAGNDYTAIVEIHDEGGGAKSYTVEIFWY